VAWHLPLSLHCCLRLRRRRQPQKTAENYFFLALLAVFFLAVFFAAFLAVFFLAVFFAAFLAVFFLAGFFAAFFRAVFFAAFFAFAIRSHLLPVLEGPCEENLYVILYTAWRACDNLFLVNFGKCNAIFSPAFCAPARPSRARD